MGATTRVARAAEAALEGVVARSHGPCAPRQSASSARRAVSSRSSLGCASSASACAAAAASASAEWCK
eukprot:4552179-Pleurochrysis_carterae.AAC.1